MSEMPSDLRIAAENYARWSNQTRRPSLAGRTAERFASALLPHLKPGMRVLDCGCGPGSITLGLAAAVAPGETIGIDANLFAIEDADRRKLGTACEETVSFQDADVHALPFEDGAFDAVFAHALLQHLPDPRLAVRELARVLKRGGVMALADFDYGGGLVWPDDPALKRSVEIMGELHAADGRSPYVGRQLAALLEDVGLARVTMRVKAPTETPISTPGAHNFPVRYYEDDAVRNYVVAHGLASDDEVRAFPHAWRRWSTTKARCGCASAAMPGA